MIWQRSGRALGGFLQIQSNGYVLYTGSPGSDPGLASTPDLSPLSGFARFSATHTGDGTVQMIQPLPPGRYAWAVVAASANNPKGASVMSAPGYFAVQGPTLTHLRTDSVAHHDANYRYPGYTLLRIYSTAYTKLKVVYDIGSRATTRTMYMGDSTEADLRVNWSCARPAAHIRYRVTASDDQGNSLTRSGVGLGVSAATCGQLYAAMIAAQQAQQRARWLAYLKQQQRLAAQQLQEINRFKTNCRAIGGTPKLLQNSDGSWSWYCVAPYGGLLNPPGGPWS